MVDKCARLLQTLLANTLRTLYLTPLLVGSTTTCSVTDEAVSASLTWEHVYSMVAYL